MKSPLVFFNVGWMREYRGISSGDQIVSGGAYIAEHGIGGEILNFLPIHGRLYGCVQTPRGGQVNLERLGGMPTDEHLDDVTIVWTARRPEGGTVVVGWYRNARIYRYHQEQTSTKKAIYRTNKLKGWFLAETRKRDAHIIESENRWFEIPRARPGEVGGMGQSNVWYADGMEREPWYKSLRKAIARNVEPQIRSSGARRVRKGHGGRQSDPELRAKVESAAIKAVVSFYRDRGFSVLSVENECCGWDLTCLRGSTKLHVEVKGSAMPDIGAELTPNEYSYLKSGDPCYRLAVVPSALKRPTPHIFALDPMSGAWISQSRRRLVIEKRVSGVVREATSGAKG